MFLQQNNNFFTQGERAFRRPDKRGGFLPSKRYEIRITPVGDSYDIHVRAAKMAWILAGSCFRTRERTPHGWVDGWKANVNIAGKRGQRRVFGTAREAAKARFPKLKFVEE